MRGLLLCKELLSYFYAQFIWENVNSKRYKNDLKVPTQNSVTFGDNSVIVDYWLRTVAIIGFNFYQKINEKDTHK